MSRPSKETHDLSDAEKAGVEPDWNNEALEP